MALALCLSTQPTTTFAEETGAVTELSGVNTADIYVANEAVSGGDVSNGDAGIQEQTHVSGEQQDAEKDAAVEAALTDEQAAGLDMTRWEKLCNALNALVQVQDDHSGEHGIDVEGQTWTAISNKDELDEAAANGYYYLAASIELLSPWTPEDGVVLCLNGHDITLSGQDNKEVITVKQGRTFTLCDCNENSGKITHGIKKEDSTKYTGNGVLVSGGTFIMTGGKITGNEVQQGGGVKLESGASFTMTGGTISGNRSTSHGGGVAVAVCLWALLPLL